MPQPSPATPAATRSTGGPRGLGELVPRLLPLLFSLLLLPVLGLATSAAQARQLWLIGGGADPVCTSSARTQCLPDQREAATQTFEQAQALWGNQFRFDQARRDALYALPRWNGGEARRQALFHRFDALRPSLQDRVLGEADWHRQLQALVLTEDELQLFDHAFEVRPLRDDGHTRRDLVYLDGSDVRSQALYRDFVALAANSPLRRTRTGKPRVLVLTASSYDVFGSVDYYLSLFEQAGAEVQWLPLEPGFIRARDCRDLDALRFAWNGAYARAARYPELAAYQQDLCEHPERLRAMVASADAFFINGGDQSLTMRSLQDDAGRFTALAALLLQRVEAGVPLGGTSAGTAVQSGNAAGTLPMVSNGSSAHALRHGAMAGEINAPGCPMSQPCTLNAPTDQLTYRPSGGLRSFDLGVADTHFFERGREGRLLRLLLDTRTPFGFGIDESTALHVQTRDDGSSELRVHGLGGVWILDARAAGVTQDAGQWRASGFHATRLLDGDSAHWHDGLLDARLDCPPGSTLAAGTLADPEAFKAEPGRQWQALDSASPVTACQRGDGRWRYLGLPMQLVQALE
jgi:cyanophycinase